jgi:hypothetical protein
MIKETKKNRDLGFRLSDIIIDSVDLFLDQARINPSGKDDFVFETSFNITPDRALNKIYFCYLIKLFSDDNKLHLLGEFKIRIAYLITHSYDFVIINNSIQLPPPVMASFFRIGYSAARGILATYTNGTVLSKAILPLVDPESFVKELQEHVG